MKEIYDSLNEQELIWLGSVCDDPSREQMMRALLENEDFLIYQAEYAESY